MNKYISGPYSISGIAGDNHILARVDNERRTIAIVTGWPGIETQEVEANKRLLAAAPDLLNALEIAVVTIKRLAKTDSANGTLDVARLAINKATGG